MQQSHVINDSIYGNLDHRTTKNNETLKEYRKKYLEYLKAHHTGRRVTIGEGGLGGEKGEGVASRPLDCCCIGPLCCNHHHNDEDEEDNDDDGDDGDDDDDDDNDNDAVDHGGEDGDTDDYGDNDNKENDNDCALPAPAIAVPILGVKANIGR